MGKRVLALVILFVMVLLFAIPYPNEQVEAPVSAKAQTKVVQIAEVGEAPPAESVASDQLSSIENKEESKPDNDQSVVAAAPETTSDSSSAVQTNLSNPLISENAAKIVAIGDSLTKGVGDSTDNGGYTYFLENELSAILGDEQTVEIDNFGVRGHRTDQLLDRLDKKKVKKAVSEADIVLITIGANDIIRVVKNNFLNLTMQLFESEQVKYMERLKKILLKVRELNADCEIYMIGLYNPFQYLFQDFEELNEIVRDWDQAGQNTIEELDNSYFIPIYDLFLEDQGELLYTDQFHPNEKGYELIADRVFTYIYEDGEV